MGGGGRREGKIMGGRDPFCSDNRRCQECTVSETTDTYTVLCTRKNLGILGLGYIHVRTTRSL